ncbi:LON-domain-containing protein [Peniophora sp. CONT]|nr:LON-domain-containing protein [Peniophora sp. CONT]
MAALLELFACALCARQLELPVTLLCGHTLCARHVEQDGQLRLAPCPLSTCASISSSPNIPSTSRVTYIPAPPEDAAPAPLASIDLHTDVTVSKVAALVRRRATIAPTNPHTSGDSTDAESESDVRPSTPPIIQRPRKRRRRQQPSEELRTHFDKEFTSELTCEICLLLFYKPLTTPCQHTFCAKCLQRSLDHSTQCPLCRHDLAGYAYNLHQPCNKVILSVLLRAFPDSYGERGRQVEQEERDARLDTPIFVCQLTFPGMPTLLHVFEPRYRLMLRRCLESPTPAFGMVMPSRPTQFGSGNDFGTMLEIRSVKMLPDGRSMVETWGTHRFRILERGILDGYMVGRVERIDDYPDTHTGPESETSAPLPAPVPAPHILTADLGAPPLPAALPPPPDQPDVLLHICHAFLDQLRQGAAPWVVTRLSHTYGPMPADAAHFSFWMAMLLPIDEYEKAKMLPIRSARLRLRLVVYWIEQLNSNWWFTNGCVIA